MSESRKSRHNENHDPYFIVQSKVLAAPTSASNAAAQGAETCGAADEVVADGAVDTRETVRVELLLLIVGMETEAEVADESADESDEAAGDAALDALVAVELAAEDIALLAAGTLPVEMGAACGESSSITVVTAPPISSLQSTLPPCRESGLHRTAAVTDACGISIVSVISAEFSTSVSILLF